MPIKKRIKAIFHLLIIISISLFILELMQTNIQNSIVPFFDKLNFTNLTARLFLITNIGCSMYYGCKLYYNRKFKKTNNVFLLILFSTTIIYTLYRFNIIGHLTWLFIPLFKNVPLYYCDVLYLYVFAVCFQYLPEKNKDTNVITKNCREDLPIKSINEDLLGYDKEASALATDLNNLENIHKSLTVSIKGKWGSGKTSYLNLLKNHLKNNKENIIIDFNPWLSSNIEQLTQDFFNTLLTEIDDKQVRNEIKKYATLITELDLGLISKIVKGIYNTNLKEQYNKLSNLILSRKKKIFILIDDLDRLHTDEVFLVIQLIRNIVSFSNTVFIVAYDENYIHKILKNKVDNPSFYLQKIFNIPYYLPKPSSNDLKAASGNILKRIFMESKNEEIDYFVYKLPAAITIRGSIQLGNVTKHLYDRMKSCNFDLALSDILFIEYLKLLDKKLYDNILHPRYQEGSIVILNKNLYCLNAYKVDETSSYYEHESHINDQEDMFLFQNFEEKYGYTLHTESDYINTVLKNYTRKIYYYTILNILFPHTELNENKLRDMELNRLCVKENFDAYSKLDFEIKEN